MVKYTPLFKSLAAGVDKILEVAFRKVRCCKSKLRSAPSRKKFAIGSLLVSHAECDYLNADMCKFESSQKHGSRAQSADTWKMESVQQA